MNSLQASRLSFVVLLIVSAFCKQKHDKEIKLLKNEYDKVKVRNEFMEISLRNKYNNCKKYSEKRLLKQVVTNKGRTGANCEVLGLKGPVRVTIKEKLENKKTKEEIEKFFIREDNLAVNSNIPRVDRRVADSLYEVDREVDDEVITDERVMKSVENNDSAIIRSDRVNEKGCVPGNDFKKARDETCGKSSNSEVINDELYSKSDTSEEKIDEIAIETLYLHDK
ncbi:hypothetical protein K1T71_010505 [Dendrolimus kikuchii]|uniref:Uncharacterized protein n=1 Tax=Dendrolimus kikuchii TaxID=765133 RepID=A0ACC1CRP9_9NEOP|nr:hypothetical protein K1T71_010505 [Dendrolimus kikuchii]